ncbi:hypothetical protein ABZ800_14495 [Streptomyces sp. NPDC047813]|uniref:hypothetical protein n=1 Tax=Streptomyces sp. NPDC047813 TaxID=3154608 RepID=UPI003402F8A8
MDKPLIVITGAGSGIGAVTARLFSARGPPLLLFARRRERLEGPHVTVREIVLAVTGQVA